MADLNLKEIHDTLVSLAFEAGKMIMSANPQDLDQGTKLNCMLRLHPLHECPSKNRIVRSKPTPFMPC
jgi:hypothetical protein